MCVRLRGSGKGEEEYRTHERAETERHDRGRTDIKERRGEGETKDVQDGVQCQLAVGQHQAMGDALQGPTVGQMAGILHHVPLLTATRCSGTDPSLSTPACVLLYRYTYLRKLPGLR